MSSHVLATSRHRDTARRGRKQNGRAYSPPREEGWLRHQENFGAAHLSAADGVVAHTENWLVSDHPVRSNKEASRRFLNVASTPPHEEGTTLAQKSSRTGGSTEKNSQLLAARPLCLCVFVVPYLLSEQAHLARPVRDSQMVISKLGCYPTARSALQEADLE